MRKRNRGFSLIELTFALAITLGMSMILFQMFQRNEGIFHDQDLMVEAQQSARAVASQIADEIRMAGQGVPVYASTFDVTPAEPVAVFLAGSGASRINFRAGLSNAESTITTPAPLDLTIGISSTLAVGSAAPFSNALGKFVYISGPASGDSWAWVRAEVTEIKKSANTLRLNPGEAGQAGRTGDVVTFIESPIVALEEAVAFYIDSGSVKRATATKMSNIESPVWSAASEIGRNFASLGFTYYDKNGGVITPDSLEARLAIARVDVQLTAETSAGLSTGKRPHYAFSLRTIPRNVRIR